MAKASKKKPAKKRSAKKIISSTDVMLPPKQRAKVLKKLKKMSLPPSHPSSITGPALELGYDAPLPAKKVRKLKPGRKPAKKARKTK